MTDTVTVDVPIRYRDLDTLNHVNNAVYATYAEEARAAYVDEVFEVSFEEFPFVIAALSFSFTRPITGTDELTVAVETTDIGNTSVTMSYDFRVDRETAATGESTLVFVDPDQKQSAPIPDHVRTRIVEFEGLDEV